MFNVMKKITILSLLLSFILSPLAYAATAGPVGVIGLGQYNSTEYLDHQIITVESDGEITAMNGINFMFEPAFHIRWDQGISSLSVTGSAVDNGKIATSVTPEYHHDKGAVHIPVLADMSAGESFTITGLRIRTYDRNIGTQAVWVDINGDYLKDFESLSGFYVNESAGTTDSAGPWAPENVEWQIVNNKPVVTWVDPVDWDFAEIRVKKYTGTGGDYSLISKTYEYISAEDTPTFTDKYYDDSVDNKYVLAPYDKYGHEGGVAVVIVPAGTDEEVSETPAEEPEEEVVEETPEEDTPAEEDDETEAEQLSRLLNYYNVRYSIKCMPSGVPAKENDSNCMWARIDLLYAQEKTGEQLRDFALSERELELMESRRRWPELRYQENCEDASEPASYCPALGKALDRISYFLD